MPTANTGRRLGARGDDRLEHGLGTVPTTRAIRGFSVNADLMRTTLSKGKAKPKLPFLFETAIQVANLSRRVVTMSS